jgi:hypothetical protein
MTKDFMTCYYLTCSWPERLGLNIARVLGWILGVITLPIFIVWGLWMIYKK